MAYNLSLTSAASFKASLFIFMVQMSSSIIDTSICDGHHFYNSDFTYKYIYIYYAQDIDYHLFKSFIFHLVWTIQVVNIPVGEKKD